MSHHEHNYIYRGHRYLRRPRYAYRAPQVYVVPQAVQPAALEPTTALLVVGGAIAVIALALILRK